jgi:hemolysin III
MHVVPVRARLTFKDPISSITHFGGFLGAVAGMAWLWVDVVASIQGAAVAFYGATLVLLFLASSTYHFFDLGERGNDWLQRIDHAAIYLLIAGTYMPFLVACMSGGKLVAMASLVGIPAIAGVLVKLSGLKLPQAVDAGLYVALGWVIVFGGNDVFQKLSAAQLGLLFGGGLAYTLGAVIFAKEWPNPWPGVFAHHEVWHVCVLAGAASHFAAVRSVLVLS